MRSKTAERLREDADGTTFGIRNRPKRALTETEEAMEQVTDPVCGMTLDPKDAVATAEHQGRTYYFCSEDCKETFLEAPDDYASGS